MFKFWKNLFKSLFFPVHYFGESDGGTEEVVEGQQPEGQVPEAEWKFRRGDKEYSREDVEKHIAAYENDQAWQAKNTKWSMELSEREKRLEKVQQLNELLTQHPEMLEEVKSMVAKGKGGSLPPELAEQMGRMSELEKKLSTHDASIQLKEDLADVKSKYKEYFDAMPDLEKAIISHAMEKDIMDLKLAARDYLFDKVGEMKLREGQQKLKDARKASGELGQLKGSKGMPLDMKTKILDKKTSMGNAISQYLDQYQ